MEIAMKFYVSIAMVLAATFFQVTQPTLSDQINQAKTAYERGDYAQAIQLYESLVAAGLRDGALYFNLASAYEQSGQSARALLNFLRAQQFIPRDTELSEHLALIRARRVDIQGDESSIMAGLAALTTNLVTVNELTVLTWLFWVAGCGLLTLQFIRPQWRRRTRVSLIVCASLFLVGVILLGDRLLYESLHPAAVLVEDRVSAMSGPGEQYLELFDLHAAAEVRVVESRESWVWIEVPDGRQGWIPKQSLVRVN
jgi:tetratricopeptide (TPR) repeat protein